MSKRVARTGLQYLDWLKWDIEKHSIKIQPVGKLEAMLS